MVRRCCQYIKNIAVKKKQLKEERKANAVVAVATENSLSGGRSSPVISCIVDFTSRKFGARKRKRKKTRAPSGIIEELDLVDYLTTRNETLLIFEYENRNAPSNHDQSSIMAMCSALPPIILSISV